MAAGQKAWLAARGGQSEVVTSAGDAWLLDTTGREWKKREALRVPLPQLGGLGEASFATAGMRRGSVTLRPPFRTPDNQTILSIPKSESIRALAMLNAGEDWIWVNGRGELNAVSVRAR